MFTSNRRHFETHDTTKKFHSYDKCTTCGNEWGVHSDHKCPGQKWGYDNPYPLRERETQNTKYVCR